MMIGEEGEEKEKVMPIEKKRELVVEEGSSDYLFDLGGYESTKQRGADSPESGELGWRLDPGSDPPDGNFSLPLVESSSVSSMILSTIEEDGEEIRTNPSISLLSISKSAEVRVGLVRPSPQIAHKMAQSNQCPVYRHRPLLRPSSSHDPSSQSFDLQGELRSRNVKYEESGISKNGEIRRRVDRVILNPRLGTLESRLKEQSRSRRVQVSPLFLGKNVRIQSSSLSDKTHNAINQSLNTTNFGIRPNLDGKLSLNSNAKQDLKLPDQLLQSFHKPNCLLSSSLLSLNNAELFTSYFSPPCFLSSQLIQDQENVPKKSEKPAVYLGENHRILDIPEFLILVGDYSHRMGYERFIKVHRETNVNGIVSARQMNEKCVISFGPLKINVDSKDGDDRYLMEKLKCHLGIDHGTLMYYLATIDRGTDRVIGTKVYIEIDPINSPVRVKLKSLVGKLNPLSRGIDIQQKGNISSVGTIVVKDNRIGWVTNKKRNTETKSRRVRILIQESTLLEEDRKCNQVSKVVTKLIGLIFVRSCFKIRKYLWWKCINGWPGLMELIRMRVRMKLAAYLLGFKMAQDEEDEPLWGSADYSKRETRLLECFPVAELGLKAENTHDEEHVAENMMGILAEILVNMVVALQRKSDVMIRHSSVCSNIKWSFYEGEMKHYREGWTAVAAELGEDANFQQNFLYFFYPP